MYYLLIDIHHLAQLAIVEPALVADIVNSTQTLCEQCGMNTVESSHYLIYSYDNLRPGEYKPLLKALFGLKNMLASHGDDLQGYSLILEAVDKKPDSTFLSLPLMVREGTGLYLGHNATKLISPLLRGRSIRGLWKIEGMKQQDDKDAGTATQFILQKPFFEKLLDQITPWLGGNRTPGEVHIAGDEFNGLHIIGRYIIQRLTVSEAIGKLVYVVLEEHDDLFCAIARSINLRDLNWVKEELSLLEQHIWKEKQTVLWDHYPQAPTPLRSSEKPERDMCIVMQLYLRAYASWSRSQGGLPLVLIYLRRQLSAPEHSFLRVLMKEGAQESRIFWFCLALPNYLPKKAIALEKIWLTLANHTGLEVHTLCKEQGFSDKEATQIAESTEHKGLALYHFLNKPESFSKLPQGRLKTSEGNSMRPAQRIIRKSLNLLDTDARELLYIFMLIGIYLDREQVFALLESRGRVRIRITELYKELMNTGYLFYEQIHNVAFENEVSRLALHPTNTGLIQDSIRFILNPHNAVRIQPGLIRFISSHSKHHTYLPAIYRHIQMLIDFRQYQRVEDAKDCLQYPGRDAQTLIDARLALESGEFSQQRIPLILPAPEFWRGEWLIIQTLFYIREGNLKEARKCCKSAIILFQNIKDDYGVGLANNIFGYLHHCSGKYQEAMHYFTITERNRKVSEGQNSILAELMCSLNNFIQGRYSRVKKALKGKNGLFARLLQSGTYSWSSAAAFLMARSHFALGEYEDARVLLERQLNSFRGPEEEQILKLFYAWIARCLIYQGRFKAGITIMEQQLQTHEVSLFKAEACILNDQYNNALKILEQPVEEASHSYSFNLLLTWQNGFSWIEDLSVKNLSEDSTLANFQHGMTAFAMGKIGNVEQSIEKFHWLTKEKKIVPDDPNLSTILYWYSRILEQSNKQDNEDSLTLLARAVKALQEKSSNIDEPADKRSFLKKVIWNHELFTSAKKYNLL